MFGRKSHPPPAQKQNSAAPLNSAKEEYLPFQGQKPGGPLPTPSGAPTPVGRLGNGPPRPLQPPKLFGDFKPGQKAEGNAENTPMNRSGETENANRPAQLQIPEQSNGQTSPRELQPSPREDGQGSSKKLQKIFGVQDFSNGGQQQQAYPMSDQDEMKSVFETNEMLQEVIPMSYEGVNGKMFIAKEHLYFSGVNRKVSIPLKDIMSLNLKKKNSIEIHLFSPMTSPYIFSGNFKKEVFALLESVYQPFASKNFSLFWAIEKNDIDRVRFLLTPARVKEVEVREEFGSTPLHNAVKGGNVVIVHLFLQYYKAMNMDINVRDMYGWTVLHVACKSNAEKESEDDILRMLIEYPGIIIDSKNNDGNTPLHYFAQNFTSPGVSELGDLLIKKVLEKGSHVNVLNHNGETPLHKAIFNPAFRIIMVQMLIANGADVNIPTHTGDTVLHYAVRMGRKDLVKALLNGGADITIRNKNKKSAFDLVPSPNDKIAEMLIRAQELFDWMKEIQMEEFFSKFLQEELYLDILVDIEEPALEKIFEGAQLVIPAGCRIRLKKGIQRLRAINHRNLIKTESNNSDKSNSDGYSTPKNSMSASTAWDVPSDLRITQEELEFTKILGTGTFGTVFKGLYKGEKVAIKVLLDTAMAKGEFKKEFEIMKTVRDPYLVQFIGASLKPKICLVMEYCSRGSLYQVLNDDRTQMTWDVLIKFGIEMFSGLKALHMWKPPIYHRDMKSLNLLVAEDFTLRLTDFGLSRFDTNVNAETMGKIVGTACWCPPEMFRGSNYIDKSDVYSGGIIIWELAYRLIHGKYQLPFKEYPKLVNNVQVLFQVATEHLRPTIPEGCKPEIAELIVRCWDPEASRRPTAAQAIEFLTALQRGLQPPDLSAMIGGPPKAPPSENRALADSEPLSPSMASSTEDSLSKKPRKIGKVYVVAIYDYEPAKPEELSFTKGSTLKIMKKKTNGWWFGYLVQPNQPQRKTGWIPSNFVEEFTAKAQGEAQRDFHGPAEDEIVVLKDDILAILDEDRESRMCLCESGGRVGWIPSDILKIDTEETLGKSDMPSVTIVDLDAKLNKLNVQKAELTELNAEGARLNTEEAALEAEVEKLRLEEERIRQEVEEETRRREVARLDEQRREEERIRQQAEERKKAEEERQRQEAKRYQMEQERQRQDQEKMRQQMEERLRAEQEERLRQAQEMERKRNEQVHEYTPPREWQHLIGWCGNISRPEAEQKLRGCLKGTFLLRWSDHAKSYVLSYVKTGPVFVHVARIVPSGNGAVTVETEENVNITYKNLLEFITVTMNKGIISMPINL